MSRIKRMLKEVRQPSKKYTFQIASDIFGKNNRIKMKKEQDYSPVVKAHATQA